MAGFLDWFFAFLTTMIGGIWKIISGIFGGIFQIFNVVNYLEQFKSYKGGFNVIDWILAIFGFILVVAIWGILIYLLILAIRKYIRFRKSAVGSEDLLEEVASLHRDVLKLTKEREKLLALKIGQTDVDIRDLDEILSTGEEEEAEVEEDVLPRFFKLDSIDQKYLTYNPPEYRQDFTLQDLCRDFRNFACSRMGLFYEEKVIRLLFAGLASTKLILLQGISGTGKTSLAYAFGKFVQSDSTVVSVQPSWRERTELYGYYNEFTKAYSETDFLRAVYEANYYRDPHLVILDEMNIARVEYYFAELLSILEMPLESEWNIDIVTATWDNDPCLINNGKLHISNNLWFVGTINNDDSTFAVADKVYDRAVPIDLDSRAEIFECEDTPPVFVHTDHLNAMFAEAKQKYPISQEMLDKLEDVNAYLIKNFRLAFGNRVMKQIQDYVPCLIACGGTEIEAVDFIVAKKVLRKFESLSLGFMKEELTRFNSYLDKTFGKNQMKICKEYVEHLKKTN